jgi:hypothetical protein
VLRLPWIAVLVVLVSCGTDDISTDQAGSESPADVLDAGVRAVLDAPTGRYTHEVVDHYFGSPVFTYSGTYDVSSESAEVFTDQYTELEREEPVEPAQTWHYKIISGREYVRSSAWPDDMSLCWLVVDEQNADEFVAERVDAAGVPLAVSALEGVTGERFDPEDHTAILGTIDLDTALHMMLAETIAAELADQFDGGVPVRLELADGVVSAWQMNGLDVLEALLELADPLVTRDAAIALKAFNLRVSYAELDSPVVIEEPDPQSHMSLSQMETGEGCSPME